MTITETLKAIFSPRRNPPTDLYGLDDPAPPNYYELKRIEEKLDQLLKEKEKHD